MASKFTITAELNLQTKNLNQVVNNLRQQFQGANLNIKIKDLASAESQLRKVSTAAKNTSKDVNQLGSSLSQAFKRFTVITAVTGTLVGFTRSVKRAVGDAIEFEREVVKIAQATGKTVSQLKGLVSQIDSVSTSFGIGSKELVLAARTLTQAGFAADKVAGSLKVLAQTELAATFDSIQDTTEGAIALLNQFGKEAQRTGNEVKFLEQSFSAINQVSKEFAVESSDIVTAIRTTGAAFESAGGNLNELIALFTSVRSTTRESAESIATGFRTIFTRVQRVDTINNLKALGINLQDAEGKFIGPIEATKKLSAALSSIDPRDFRFNLVVEELGGFRQVSKVIPLIQQFAVAQKALGVAQGSSGSLAKDAETAQQSLAVQIAKTREEFSRFIRELVGSSSFQDTAQFLLRLANSFIKVADSIKPLIPLIAGFAAIKVGNALGVGLKSFATQGAKGRDVPIGFATGGLVPGSGNGDTVPAMLTPGEFVIRKSSVNKLGARNLARVNKYADGGKIEDQTSIGAAILEPGIREDSSYKLDKETKEKLKSNTDLYNKVKNKTWEIKKQGVSTKTYSKFRDAIEYGLSQGLEAAVSKSEDFTGISPVKLTKQNERNFLDTINEGSYGNMFEQILTFAKDKGEFDANSDPKRPFDFTNGLPKLLSGDFSDLNMRFVDAKASRAAASKVGDKIARELLYDPTSYTAGKRYQEEAYQSALDKEVRVGEKTKEQAVTKSIQDQAENFRLKMVKAVGNQTKFKFVDGLSANNIGKFQGGGPNAVVTNILDDPNVKFGKNDFNLTRNQQAKVLKTLRAYRIQSKSFGGFIEKFANGGFSSGTDTVPAMLTPGEFVVNKKSAQKIGYASLNRMNKVGKYASGGIVQHFADGTSGTGVKAESVANNIFNMRSSGIGDLQKMQEYVKNFQQSLLDTGLTLEQSEKFLDLFGAAASKIEMPLSNITKFLLEKAVQLQAQSKAGFVGPPKPKAEPLKDAKLLKSAYYSYKAGKNTPKQQSSNEFVGPPRPPVDKPKPEDGLTKNSADLANKFLILGSAASSVVSQLGLFDQKTADVVSSLTGTFATIKGIGGQLTSAAAGFKKKDGTAIVSDKAIKTANIAITGFAAAQAVAAARSTIFGQKAEEAGKRVDSFIDALTKGEGTSKSQLAEALTQEFKSAESQRARSSTARSGISAGAGIAVAGLATYFSGGALAPIAPAIAAAVTPLFDEGLFQLGVFAGDLDKASKQAESLSNALYSAATSNRDFEKFMKNIENQAPKNIANQANSLANAYQLQIEELAKFKDVDLASASDVVKQRFDAVSEAAKKTAANLQQTLGIQFQGAVKRSAELLDMGFVPDTEKLLAPIFDTIRKEAEAKYKSSIESAGGETTQKGLSLKNQREKEIAIAQEQQRKSLTEATKQQLELIAAQKLETDLRNKLIGSLQKQLAISAASERMAYELNRVSDSISDIDARYSGNLTGMKSKYDTSVLGLKSPDEKRLSDALEPVRSLGPIGGDLASNIIDVNKVLPNLEAKLIQFSTATDTVSGALFDVEKFVEQSFGVKAGSIVGKALVGIIEDTTRGTGGERGVTAAKTSLREPEVRKKIVETFEKFGEEFKTSASDILNNMAAAERGALETAQKLNESRQKQIELSMQSVDSLSRYAENVSKATGKDLSLYEKNYYRNLKQQILAGNLANNSAGIGKRLSDINNSLKDPDLDPNKKAALVLEQSKLKSALEGLANQADRASDVLNQIEKIKAQRESIRDIGREFATGTPEEQNKLAQELQAAMTVAATGTFQSIPQELRKGADAIFERFKDIPGFKQAQNTAIADQFMRMGAPLAAQMVMTETTTPEQKLLMELKFIAFEELKTQLAQMALEQQKQTELQDGINAYSDQIGGYTKQLEALVQKFEEQAKEKAVPLKPTSDIATPKTNLPNLAAGPMGVLNKLTRNPSIPEDAKAKIDTENIKEVNAQISNFDEAIGNSETKIFELTASLNLLRENFDRLNASGLFKELEARKKQEEAIKAIEARTDLTQTQKQDINAAVPAFGSKLANGGIVYRADGGSIFKPRGTDTVPAMLTPGEYVIKKSSVDSIGTDTLDAINSGQYRANGGLIYRQQGGGSSFSAQSNSSIETRLAKLEKRVESLQEENQQLKNELSRFGARDMQGMSQQMQQMNMSMQQMSNGMGMTAQQFMQPRQGRASRKQRLYEARANARAVSSDSNEPEQVIVPEPPKDRKPTRDKLDLIESFQGSGASHLANLISNGAVSLPHAEDALNAMQNMSNARNVTSPDGVKQDLNSRIPRAEGALNAILPKRDLSLKDLMSQPQQEENQQLKQQLGINRVGQGMQNLDLQMGYGMQGNIPTPRRSVMSSKLNARKNSLARQVLDKKRAGKFIPEDTLRATGFMEINRESGTNHPRAVAEIGKGSKVIGKSFAEIRAEDEARKYGDSNLSDKAKDIASQKTVEGGTKYTQNLIGNRVYYDKEDKTKQVYDINKLKDQFDTAQKTDTGYKTSVEAAQEYINKMIPGAEDRKLGKFDTPFYGVKIDKGGSEQIKPQLKSKIDSAAIARKMLTDNKDLSQNDRMIYEERIAQIAKLGLEKELAVREKQVVKTDTGGYTFQNTKPQIPENERIKGSREDTSKFKRPSSTAQWKGGKWVEPNKPNQQALAPQKSYRDLQLEALAKISNSSSSKADWEQGAKDYDKYSKMITQQSVSKLPISAQVGMKKAEVDLTEKDLGLNPIDPKDATPTKMWENHYNFLNKINKNPEEYSQKYDELKNSRSQLKTLNQASGILNYINDSAYNRRRKRNNRDKTSWDILEENKDYINRFNPERDIVGDYKKNYEDSVNTANQSISNTSKMIDTFKLNNQSLEDPQHPYWEEFSGDSKKEKNKNPLPNIPYDMHKYPDFMGNITNRASGGSIDSVPAMLTPGEYVINSNAVSKHGKAFMDHLNRGGEVPGFNTGGFVNYLAGGGRSFRGGRTGGRSGVDRRELAKRNGVMSSAQLMQNQFANNPMVQQLGLNAPQVNMQTQQQGGGANTGAGAGAGAGAAAGAGITEAVQQFSQFVGQFQEAAKMMAGMTMTHKVTIDGQVNINGIDGPGIAKAIKEDIGTYIKDQVVKIMDEKNSKGG